MLPFSSHQNKFSTNEIEILISVDFQELRFKNVD